MCQSRGSILGQFTVVIKFDFINRTRNTKNHTRKIAQNDNRNRAVNIFNFTRLIIDNLKPSQTNACVTRILFNVARKIKKCKCFYVQATKFVCGLTF